MRPRDESKEQTIREKALEMIVKTGFDGLSMHKLAREAGVSPATIYIYFKDREDLILQLCISEVEKMIRITFEGFDPNMGFAEGLRVQWRNRAKYLLEHPLEAQFMEQARHSPYGETAHRQAKYEFSKNMSSFVHRAIEKGELEPLNREVYWSVAFAPLYQLIKFHHSGGMHNDGFQLTQEMIDKTLDLVLKALKP